MSTTETVLAPAPPAEPTSRRGRWIEHWEPEDPIFWETTGKRIAKKNLVFSIIAEHMGFSVWVLWTIVVINLGNIGITLSVSELFVLTAVPNLVGSFLRIPYTFAVPRFGGRAWTVISASLLFIPVLLLAIVVPSGWLAGQAHDAQLWILVALRRHRRVRRRQLLLVDVQHLVLLSGGEEGLRPRHERGRRQPGRRQRPAPRPLAIIVGIPAAAVKLPKHDIHMAYAGLMWLPLIAIAALGAWLYMDSLHPGEGGQALLREVARVRPDLDHVVPVHRDVRLVHRLLLRPPAGHQEHLP